MAQHVPGSTESPILCLDTCSVLDVLRDPSRRAVNPQELDASLFLLDMAETGAALEVRVADQVRREYAAQVEGVQEEATLALAELQKGVRKIDELAALYGCKEQVVLEHWDGYPERCRQAADRWMNAARTTPRPSDVEKRAFARVNKGLPPAGRGKSEMKDCVILETYLAYVRALRTESTRTVVFVSSNTTDFANDRRNDVADEIRDELLEVDLKYAPNMRIARRLLGLLPSETWKPSAGEFDTRDRAGPGRTEPA